jgi:outer membrane protein assembly factor BamB
MAAKTAAGTLRVPSAVKLTCQRCFWTFLLPLASSIALPSAVAQPIARQPGFEILRGELSEVVHVDEASHEALSLLEIAKAQIAEQQWGEAIEKLRQVEDSAGSKLFKVEDRRFIPLREYCQLLVSRFPEEGLAIYRDRVDPLAKNWCEDGIAARDAHLLQRVVDQYFNSSWGDDALLALGEMALERGEHQKAFALWEQISRKLRPAGGLPLWLAFPDTNLNLADVRARLVLTLILAGDLRLAKVELQSLTENHPGAKGKLGGREVIYADALADMIAAAKSWPKPSVSGSDWPTFAGSQSRQHVANGTPSLQNPGTPITLRRQNRLPADVVVIQQPVLPKTDNIDGKTSARSKTIVLANDCDEIFAFDADTGKPAWKGDSTTPGRIFWGGERESVAERPIRGRPLPEFGLPQFTLTVFDRWLLARLGSPVTGQIAERRQATTPSYIVCLDLQAEGRLHWKLKPDDARWAFEGTPVCDGTNVYVALRYHDDTGASQQHVDCFDLQTGARRWRQMVCAAQSISRGLGNDVTHNLLTLAGDMLYLNTNLGAVAAIEKTDGAIRWLTTYPRNGKIDPIVPVDRELNPAVYDRGILFVAPEDFSGIMAFDAITGQLLWDSELPGGAAQLLGVSEGKLWASGKELWALDVRSGKEEYQSPSTAGGANSLATVGNGRGLLAGDKVYWPVRTIGSGDKSQRLEYGIRVIDAQTMKEISPLIRLNKLNPPCESGNLVMTDQYFVITSPDRVTLFALPPKSEEKDLTD